MTRDMPHDDSAKMSYDQTEQSPGLLEHPSYEELEKKLTEAEQKIADCEDRLIRVQAEAANAARRAERDVGNAHKYALERFTGELLPIIDSLELCVSNIPTENNQTTQAVIEGVQLTLKMFLASLVKFGIQQVNPVSEAFNPEYHQAISMQVDAQFEAGTVISVLQKGYTLNQRLVRPALVVVAKSAE